MTLTTAKWTTDEYHRMLEVGLLDHRQVELLRGEIIEMSPESPEHSYLGDEISQYLTRLLGDQARIRDGHPITLPDHSEPEPDIAVVRPLGATYRQRHPHPEDIFWLIEVANTSLTKDLEVKRTLYAAAGIQEYWVVNLQQQRLHIFRNPVEADYQDQALLTEGEIQPLAFPHISLSVQRLLQAIED